MPRYKNITLQEQVSIGFPNNTTARMSYEPFGPRSSVAPGTAVLEFENGLLVRMPGVVDDGEASETPNVFVVTGNNPNIGIFLGGTIAYRLKSSGVLEERIPLSRRWEDSEYWKTEVVETRFGLVFVFESAIVLIDDDLRVVFQGEKLFNDFFAGFNHNRLWFRLDNDVIWSLELPSGVQHR